MRSGIVAHQFISFGPPSGPDQPLMIVWVPSAELQLQWLHPKGAVQVKRTARLIPPGGSFGKLWPVGKKSSIPRSLISAAEKYLKKLEHQQAQTEVLRKACDRITMQSRANEADFQKSAQGFLHNPAPIKKGRKVR